jgi:hypothetical protein
MVDMGGGLKTIISTLASVASVGAAACVLVQFLISAGMVPATPDNGAQNNLF